MNRRKMLTAALFGTAAAGAQNVRREVQVIQSGPGMAGGGDHMIFMGAPAGGGAHAVSFVAAGNMDGKVLKNAPYSADSVTESTRTLADGTRIVNKQMSSVARDKEGRMRRESDLNHIGPFQQASVTLPKLVTIIDPVAKEVIMLNANDKTARRSKMGEPMVVRSDGKEGSARIVNEQRVQVMVRKHEGGTATATATATGGAEGSFHVFAPGDVAMGATGVRTAFDSKNVKTENLGKQVMEGVQVEGTRTTHTIPAGQIGNDRAIQTVTERWYSAELEIVVFSKVNDPQIGETVYRVTNLKRTEPDANLFKVPGDYKMMEVGKEPMIFRRKLDGVGEQI